MGSRAHGLCRCGAWAPKHVGSVVCSMWALLLRHASSVVVVCGFSLSSCGVWAPGHVGSVVCSMRALSLRHVSSVVVACGFSLCSCGVWAPGHVGSVVCSMQALSLRRARPVVVAHRLSCPVACGILVPRPGIKPTSLSLEGGLFTTGLPGKSQVDF